MKLRGYICGVKDNPFRAKVGRVMPVYDMNTGEEMRLVGMVKGGGMFVKLFISFDVGLLSGNGAVVFLRVAALMRMGQDWIDVKGIDMNKGKLYRGLNELIQAGVLSRRTRGTYWVNSLVLCQK